MGWTTDLLTGLAVYLDAQGVATWRPDGSAYTAGETGIVIRDIPEQPARLITLASYPLEHLRGMQDLLIGVQIRVRGLPRSPGDCDDLADRVFEELDSIGHTTWGGVEIVDCNRQSHASLGADGQHRWSASHNYYVDAMRATTYNTD